MKYFALKYKRERGYGYLKHNPRKAHKGHQMERLLEGYERAVALNNECMKLKGQVIGLNSAYNEAQIEVHNVNVVVQDLLKKTRKS